MRSSDYEEREKEANERLFRRGALIIIISCHTMSAAQWICYLIGGAFWGG